MKTTVSVIKADIGSVSGHCVAHPDLMEICEEVLADALETGILKDFYVSRCGDDIDLIIFGMKFVYLADEAVVKEEIKSFEENLKINQKDFIDKFKALFNSNYLSSYCNKLVKKDLFVSNGVKFDVGLTNYEDLSAVLQTLCFANTIATLSEPYYIYLMQIYKNIAL